MALAPTLAISYAGSTFVIPQHRDKETRARDWTSRRVLAALVVQQQLPAPCWPTADGGCERESWSSAIFVDRELEKTVLLARMAKV
jgi:hypothetical protein